ncbi:MAG: glycogen synthase GlgA [Methylococcaceae bacterium]|nr:glycogen synthase GlgA [Methylococcaceae bacterium]
MKKILFVTSEAHPLIKTGGLADVAGSLPKALAELGQDIRILLPFYQAIKTNQEVYYRCTVRVNNSDVNILESRMQDSNVIIWLVDYPAYFSMPGNPYVDIHGQAWPNNAERFALFCRIAAEIATNRAYLDWQPDIVHCNDWQTGLTPALLSLETTRPATVFTIHNMAYQGIFPASTYPQLNLPGRLWNPNGLEFHNQLSFIKGGLAFSDHITTVSPTYAEEIQTAEFGYGLEDLLKYRQAHLTGIINGMDLEQWDPATDSTLASQYDADNLDKKQLNKAALQQAMNLPVAPKLPLFALISRLVDQKGIDMVLDCLPEMINMPCQFVLLGSGDKVFEERLQRFAQNNPTKIAIRIGYDESLAHLIEAGADIFLMPSRFEPCGLNQLYSQRYGTLPIVRKTGGLADTVVDAIPETINDHTASGIVFNAPHAGALLEAIKRCQLLFNDPKTWRQLQKNAMRKDFSWQNSAQQYLKLYEQL